MKELNNIINKYKETKFLKQDLVNDLNTITDLKIEKDENNTITFSIRKSEYYIEYENHSNLISIVTFDSINQVFKFHKL